MLITRDKKVSIKIYYVINKMIITRNCYFKKTFVINKKIKTKKEGIFMKTKEELQELLIVVDMINGFIKEGNMADETINHITPKIIKLIEKTLEKNEGLAFIKDTHNENSTEFKKFPIHCLQGTSEAELIDELKSYEKDALVYEKNSTSTMFAKGFINDIDKMKALRKVIITGCCTDICVLNLAIPLVIYFDETDRQIEVEVVEDAVETYDAPYHNRNEYNEMAFKLMKQAGVRI